MRNSRHKTVATCHVQHGMPCPGMDLTGEMRKGHTQRHAENLELGRLGSLMEEMKHPGSSLWLLYRVEQGGGVVAYC